MIIGSRNDRLSLLEECEFGEDVAESQGSGDEVEEKKRKNDQKKAGEGIVHGFVSAFDGFSVAARGDVFESAKEKKN